MTDPNPPSPEEQTSFRAARTPAACPAPVPTLGRAEPGRLVNATNAARGHHVSNDQHEPGDDGSAPTFARPGCVCDRRDPRDRRCDPQQSRRAGGGRRRRLQPGPRNGRAFTSKLTQERLQGSIHQGNIAWAEDCRRTAAEVIEQHGHLDVSSTTPGSRSTRRS
jgi:hypothetical protein